jgi:hypothetical protein
VVKRLRQSATEERTNAPPFLENRILTALSRSQPTPERTPVRLQPLALTAAAMACTLIAILFFVSRLPLSQEPATTRANSSSVPDPVHAFEQKLTEVNRDLWHSVNQKWENPLASEIRLVVSDAKTAANALADNFLPESIRQNWSLEQLRHD